LVAHGRREAVSGPRGVDQSIAFLVPEDERIERFRPSCAATDYELLALIDAHFIQAPERRPGSYRLSRRFATRASKPWALTE
jgi:hypothetical protein